MSQKKKDIYTETEELLEPADSTDTEQERAVEAETPEAELTEVDDLATDELQAQLEAARTEAADNAERFIRAKAEVENIQRRSQIDLANAHKYAIEKFATELLTVRDSLELARAVDLH